MTSKEPENLNRAETTAKRRMAIVEAAAGCFIAKGFHQTSMRDIASAGGVSLGNLYNHFENKADLILALAAIEAKDNADLMALLSKGWSGSDRLWQFADMYMERLCDPGEAALAAEILAEAMRNSAINEIFDANHQNLTKALSAYLEKGQAAGHVDGTLDPSATAVHLFDLMESAAMRTALRGRGFSGHERSVLLSLMEKILAVA